MVLEDVAVHDLDFSYSAIQVPAAKSSSLTPTCLRKRVNVGIRFAQVPAALRKSCLYAEGSRLEVQRSANITLWSG